MTAKGRGKGKGTGGSREKRGEEREYCDICCPGRPRRRDAVLSHVGARIINTTALSAARAYPVARGSERVGQTPPFPERRDRPGVNTCRAREISAPSNHILKSILFAVQEVPASTSVLVLVLVAVLSYTSADRLHGSSSPPRSRGRDPREQGRTTSAGNGRETPGVPAVFYFTFISRRVGHYFISATYI